MRRQLIVVFVAVSAMVALAFVVPLAFLVRSTAEDRAIDAARADASGIVPALAAEATRTQVESAIGATVSGRDGRLTVLTADGGIIGPDVALSERIEEALRDGASGIGPVDAGIEVVVAVSTGEGELSAVRVFVSGDELRGGHGAAWITLGLVAVTLVALSVAVADRLARSIVRPTQQLAEAAHRLGAGDLEARVAAGGPPELVELADAFNRLGAQVSTMLVRERELVAELSHRLRTPLTKLRMRLDQVTDETLAEELRGDIDDVTVVVNELIEEARSSLAAIGKTCDVAEVVANRVAFWSALAEDTERQWEYTSGPSPTRVPVSEALLAAVVDVLIDNVFAHTPDGTRFDVGFERRTSDVRLWVGDAGEGFEPGAVERGASGSGSTGLGLDIARSTASAAGGSLTVGDSVLGGVEISVLFPVTSNP